MLVLGIESSCDETAAAVVADGERICSSAVASQILMHEKYGGVVPELASREHLRAIEPVVDEACRQAGVTLRDVDGIAVTEGPGLIGSLMVGLVYGKALALSLGKPLVGVNHLEGHIHAVMLENKMDRAAGKPLAEAKVPAVTLVVSGGHTILFLVSPGAPNSNPPYPPFAYSKLGHSRDDAAGEAFDKCGKVMGFQYPAGPVIDKLAAEGNLDAYRFAKPFVKGLDFSFSGLKTSFLYFLRDKMKDNPDFISENRADLCASLQHTIISILMSKLIRASAQTGITEIGIAGGVSANSGLRNMIKTEGLKRKWNLFIPPFSFTTDNAAMIGITGYYKYLRGDFSGQDISPLARFEV